MLRKRRVAPADAVDPAVANRQPPVNVVVVVESGRRRRRSGQGDAQDDEGHPLIKTVLGLAVAKRLVRRRKRPLSKRVKKAVRKGKRKVKRTTRKVRRALQ